MKRKTVKRYVLILVAGVALTLPAAVTAADGAALYTGKTCVACHGANGNKPLLPIYPKIGGQNAAYAEQQMKDIKSGARTNGQSVAMTGIMYLVNDEEIKTLAVWLEAQK